MNTMQVLAVVFATLKTAALVAAPLLLVGFLVGLVVSLLQVATSIQDITFTFVPKIVAVAAVFFIAFHWITRTLVDFAVATIGSLPSVAP